MWGWDRGLRQQGKNINVGVLCFCGCGRGRLQAKDSQMKMQRAINGREEV